jgi:hypothetical protein
MKINFEHGYKLSEGGYFHWIVFAFSVGSNGFAIYLLGFSMVIKFNDKNDEDTDI